MGGRALAILVLFDLYLVQSPYDESISVFQVHHRGRPIDAGTGMIIIAGNYNMCYWKGLLVYVQFINECSDYLV